MTRPTIFEPEIFAECVPDSPLPQPCTVIPDDGGWTGVTLAAPRRVAFDPHGDPVVPICGYHQLPIAELAAGEPEIWIEVRVDGRHLQPQPYTQPRSPDAVPPPRAEADPADIAGITEGSFFSFDLLQYVPPIAGPASVDVRATVLRRSSEPQRIMLVPILSR